MVATYRWAGSRAAVKAAQAVGYVGAGTVEFIATGDAHAFTRRFEMRRGVEPGAQAGEIMLQRFERADHGYANRQRETGKEAGAMLASGQQGAAIDLYKQIAKDDSGPIGSVAPNGVRCIACSAMAGPSRWSRRTSRSASTTRS